MEIDKIQFFSFIEQMIFSFVVHTFVTKAHFNSVTLHSDRTNLTSLLSFDLTRSRSPSLIFIKCLVISDILL